MRNKQVEFNPYIYTLTTLSKLYRFGYQISVFLIQNTRLLFYGHTLFVVTPSHVASSKIECQNFSNVYRRRIHWVFYHWMKNKKCNIIYIQESHFTNNINDSWHKEFKGEMLHSHGSSQARGVSILLKIA